ncbi:glycosyltransferase [Parageobacillus thermoglucosidasius]|uniref:glycosyltransferase n=1 Tax=Parageobacillus thermoglucosidasius TaxID=1426 RepID=UPI0027E5DCEE|nr:glycosyltransferase [Parageobacillus thermoglucosidasius]
MKVAFFQFYPPTLWNLGGGETMLLKTKEYLEKGYDINIELFDIWSRKKDYDIMHIFGSSYHHYEFAKIAKELGMKIVLSSIAYSPKPKIYWQAWKQIDKLIPIDTTYTLRKKLYNLADVIIANSEVEKVQQSEYFDTPLSKFEVIHLGGDIRFSKASKTEFENKYGISNYILCVARINPRKNQIRLIEALKGTGIPLVFIGPPDHKYPKYIEEFINKVKETDNVLWIEHIDHNSTLLASAYKGARVHVNVARGEFPGLCSIEAGLAGINVVAVKDPTVYEYLKDYVIYCDPDDIISIKESVMNAYNSNKSMELQRHLIQNHTWQVVAEKTYRVYKNILK